MSIASGRVGFLLVCFFLSGATGLVYEVLWLRMLGLVFGHTVYAITTVLTGFMAGLALGSLIFARQAARIRNLVLAYGTLEIGTGLYCALIPVLLGLASSLYLGLDRLLSFSYDAFSFVQFLVVLSVLLVPTTLMGGTLPVLSQALIKRDRGLGRTVGMLYAVNTFGAVGGVIVAGYLLLPAIGNHSTTALAATANVVVGLGAIAYSRSWRLRDAGVVPVPAEPGASGSDAPADDAPGLGAWLTIAALGVSGALSMVYEVAWTRALALMIGSSIYAFTSMLVAFLVGIAGGSALFSWLWGARRHQQAAFAVIQAGIGVAVACTVLFFERVPELVLLALHRSDSPSFVQLLQLSISAAALLPSTLLIGATFPCAVAVVARAAARAGWDVGRVYAVNTLGAIAGAVLAGFVLIPAIGVQASIKAGIVANLLLAGLVLVTSTRPAAGWRWGGLAGSLTVAAGVVFIAPWDPRVMSSGPAIYAKRHVAAADLWSYEVLFYRDGPSATVSVHRAAGNVSLQVNGKTDASVSSTGSVDMPTQVMLGHLGLLLHPDPKRALVIGLGSGTTAGAVAKYPIEHMDIAEIEPAVVEANRFFAESNGHVLKDPRVRTVIADARNFLLTTAGRYDVIISEPSNPWVGGVASLFTEEFFRLARERLRPGGIMVQWIHAYTLLPADLRMVVGTFQAVFPAASVWHSAAGDYLLLGRIEPTPLDLDLVKARFEASPAIRQDLAQIGVERWPGVLGFFVLDESDTARFAEGARLNTDDRLELEFSAPRALYLDTTNTNWRLLRSFKRAELPRLAGRNREEIDTAEAQYSIARVHLGRGDGAGALLHLSQALARDPRHLPSLLTASDISLKAGRSAEALALARRGLALDPRNPAILYIAGLASEKLNAPKEAMAFLERAIGLDPDNADVRQALWRIGGKLEGNTMTR